MSSPQRLILVLFAHPALQKSQANRRLIREPQQMEGVHFHDLYEAYPRFDIDVGYEQQLLSDHDIIVLQHPLYWYSTPAILKEWQDLVLEHGWAYGAQGNALQGKRWLQVVTAGGSEEAYCARGANRLTVRQLLSPLEQTARLCGMRFLPPFVVHGTHTIVREGLEAHAADYHDVLLALKENRLDEDAVSEMPRLNGDLSRCIRPRAED